MTTSPTPEVPEAAVFRAACYLAGGPYPQPDDIRRAEELLRATLPLCTAPSPAAAREVEQRAWELLEAECGKPLPFDVPVSAALSAVKAALSQQPASPNGTVNVVGMPEFDGLMDHIYEYGTTAEGVVERANAFARAILARYAPQQPAVVDEGSRSVTDQLLHWCGIPVRVTGTVTTSPSNWPLIDAWLTEARNVR